MSTKRARRDEQKEDRRFDILVATSVLFKEMPFQVITMAQVAERVGLAKGTLYLYFKTKEELFLAMLEDELSAWFDSLSSHMSRLEPGLSAQDLASLIAERLDVDHPVVRLLGLLHAVLEQNVEPERVIAFKRVVRHFALQAGAELERLLPYLTGGQGTQLILRANALVVGLYQTAVPSPAVAEALRRDPSLAMFETDFAQELEATLTALIMGMERQGDQYAKPRVERKNRPGHGRFERPWG
jgi:AcrR family transcriptional regulator